ncbi:MAG: cysteine desulfurase family protein [Phycisphaerales bacterium]|nr:cysteine desulfurase family protein [Phycisphaerales bacterium]
MTSGQQQIYLDANATTQPLPVVLDAMHRIMTDVWANPSSIHRAGQLARREVDEAREHVCNLIGARDSEVIFTSGGTESINTSLRSLARWRKKRLILTSAIEHSAVREQLEDLEATEDVEIVDLQHDDGGVIQVDHLDSIIREREEEISFVTVMWANNETGVIQPIHEIGNRCRDAGIPFHSDATQWVGKMPVNLAETPVDMISFAGHKFHGPKGSGVLWLREGLPLHAMLLGGGQERRRRGGTESVADIVGLGVACHEASKWIQGDGYKKMFTIRDSFEAKMQSEVPVCCVNAKSYERLWSTSNIGFPDVEAELMLLGLSEAGLCASAGSACSSGALKESSVIGAIGRQPCHVDDQPYGSVRFSIDRTMDAGTLDSAAGTIRNVYERFHGLVPKADWPLSADKAST